MQGGGYGGVVDSGRCQGSCCLGFGECADPRQLRYAETVEMIDFAATLHAALR